VPSFWAIMPLLSGAFASVGGAITISVFVIARVTSLRQRRPLAWSLKNQW
jgi:hypothetical protein